MSEIKWIKLFTDIFKNRKITAIEAMPDGQSIINTWFKLLCLAGSTNDDGAVYLTPSIPYTPELLANEFRQPAEEIEKALATFERFEMVEIDGGGGFIRVKNWEKYQNTEKMEVIKEQTRERVRAYREKKKATECNADVTRDVTQNVTLCNAGCNAICNADVTLCNGDVTDKKEERRKKKVEEDLKEKDIEKESVTRPRFVKPSADDVEQYANSLGAAIDGKRFCDYYISNGWHVGRNKMKDWRAAVRGWIAIESKTARQNAAAEWDFMTIGTEASK